MFIRLFNSLRCKLAGGLLRTDRPWRYAIARRLAPSTASLIAHRPRNPAPLPLPPRSHLIYHQHTVDAGAARNSLESLAAQIPTEDEILLLDIHPTGDRTWLDLFAAHAWFTYSACRAPLPEQRSYTYGLNAAMPGLKAPWLFVWRTDYVYPPGVMSAYLRQLPTHDFASPYRVWIGQPEVDSTFVRAHWGKLDPFDERFWRAFSTTCSLYETQDCALFAIRRSLWESIGGLHHALWGYGWQFAEFAARLRAIVPDSRISYFDCPPPLHQTHSGTLMHASQHSAQQQAESRTGLERFARFLGGADALACYRLRQMLPSRQAK